MPRSKSRGKKSTKKAAASSPVDLSDPNINAAVTVACVLGLGAIGGGLQAAIPKSHHDLFGALRLEGIQGNVNAEWWPYSLLLTFHVLNSVKSNGRWWVNDLVSCCFAAYGGQMMKNVLNGNFELDYLFGDGEANLALLIFCWYIVNHDIPFTGFNVWTTLSGAVSPFVPLDSIMNLCTLVYNTSLVVAVASSQTAAESGWKLMPISFGKALFMTVAIACSSDFFSVDGFSFDVGTHCSDAANRASLIAFWCASEGLAKLPFVGDAAGKITGQAEDFFGGRSNAIMTVVVLTSLIGHLIPMNPFDMASEQLYKVFGVKR